jgi:hypothetical protein
VDGKPKSRVAGRTSKLEPAKISAYAPLRARTEGLISTTRLGRAHSRRPGTRHSWPAAPRSIITDYCERVAAEHSSNRALIWLEPTRVSAFGEQREVAARDDIGPTRRIVARINAVADASVLRKHRRHDVAHVTGLRQAGLR